MKKEKMLSKDPRQNICSTRSGIVMFVKTVIIIYWLANGSMIKGKMHQRYISD